MESAVHVVTPHSSDSLRAVPNAQTLAASAVYQLSETGRKASLLAGGDGKAVIKGLVVGGQKQYETLF